MKKTAFSKLHPRKHISYIFLTVLVSLCMTFLPGCSITVIPPADETVTDEKIAKPTATSVSETAPVSETATEAEVTAEPTDPVLTKAISDLVSYKTDDITYSSAREYVVSLSYKNNITLNEVLANLTKDGFHYYGYYAYNSIKHCWNCIVVTEDDDCLCFEGHSESAYDSPFYTPTYYLQSVNSVSPDALGQKTCTDPMNREYKTAHTLVNGSWFDANADGTPERFLIANYAETNSGYYQYEYEVESFLLEFPATGKYIEWEGCNYAFSYVEPDFMEPVIVITPWVISCSGDGSELYSVIGNEAVFHGQFIDGHTSESYAFYDDHMETDTVITTITMITMDSVEFALNDDGIFVPLFADGYVSFLGLNNYGEREPGGMILLTARMELPVYAGPEKGEIAFTLKEGDSIQVLGGNAVDWVKIKNISTGAEGWFNHCGLNICLPDGTEIYSTKCFDNVACWG